MRIASSATNFSDTHTAAHRSTKLESLRSWVGERRPDFEAVEREARQGRGHVLPETDHASGEPPSGRALTTQRIAGLTRRLGAAVATPSRTPQQATGTAGKSGAATDDEL